MKKWMAALLALGLLAASTALANVRFTGSCYVYEKPGSGKTDVTIEKGSVLEDIDYYGSYWVKVRLSDGTAGWVRSKYVTDTSREVDDVSITYAGGADRKSTEGKKVSASGSTVTATGRVNVRDAACLDSNVVFTLEKGDKAKYLGEAREDSRGVVFYKIKFKGNKGWVSSAYAKLK